MFLLSRWMKCAILLLVCGAAAQANDRIGNGGGVIVCPNGSGGFNYELLDLYMARTQFHLVADFAGAQGKPYEEIVDAVLSRFAILSPKRAAKYRDGFNNFLANTEFKAGVKLVFIPDTGSQDIPSSCELLQVAVQKNINDILPGEKRIVVAKDIWDQMDEENKAALVLHELIYGELMDTVPNARYVRYFNGHLLAQNFLQVDYRKLAWDTKLRWYEEGGSVIDVQGNELAGKMQSANRVVRTDFLHLPNNARPLCRAISYLPMSGFNYVSLYGCGNFIYPTLISAHGLQVLVTFKTTDYPTDLFRGEWSYFGDQLSFRDGEVESGVLATAVNFPGGKVCPADGMLLQNSVSGWKCYGVERSASGYRPELFSVPL